MHDVECFVFGSELSERTKRDAVSSLPLEITWKIFTYLNNTSLANASNTCKLWRRIILANRKLRSRLNTFDLCLRVGSASMVKFMKRNRRILKKVKARNFVPKSPCPVESMKTEILKSKRGGDDIIVCTKRYKLF